MLALHLSPVHPACADADAAVARAAAQAAEVSGAFARTPVRFVRLPAPPLAGTVPDRGDGVWVLVSCERSADAAHEAHLGERCRTAVQRFTLSLWQDGVEAVWLPDHVPPPDVLRRAGADLGSHAPVGLVWCPAAAPTEGAA